MADCCALSGPETRRLVIVGGGSAAFAAAIRASELAAEAVIVNDGLPLGGTCVNVGCVPSKTLIRAAEALHRARAVPFAGIEARGRLADFGAVIEQKRTLVGGLRQAKYLDIVNELPGVRLVAGRACFTGPREVSAGGERLIGDAFLIATGARPAVPPIPGLGEVGFLTNETAFELEELPESLIVLGGRYIALETAQLFARLGTRVTILQRSDRILPSESPDLTEALADYLRAEGISIATGVVVREVGRDAAGVVVRARVAGEEHVLRGSHLLLAAGRAPNTRGLGLEAIAVDIDASGFLVVDEALRTSVPGVYGAGDVIGEPMFVYSAAAEGKLAAENALTGAGRKRDLLAVPWVIFTDPQVAGVGMDERQAAAAGVEAEAAVLPLAAVPRAIAARDTRGFVKLIRDPASDRLLGARILAPEGGELLMELVLAIRHRITVTELADTLHPYLTLSEAVKLAALSFGKDIAKLSCCAT
jgi:mercuric reductase